MVAPKIKKIVNQKQESNEDKLSSLPDCILIHILSFLDTESAIKTSVLSKRYRLLWTSLQCLDFKFHGCSVDRFLSFVNHVLERREHSNLSMFRLSLKEQVNSGFLDNCIAYAMKHKVEHLRIRAYADEHSPLTLPSLLLNSSSLRILRLNNVSCCSIMLPKSLALPGLKVLRLKNFVFSDENYNGELFLGCPNLETLILNKCSIRPDGEVKVLDVKCLNLKNLEIRHWRSPWRCFDEHMISVNAPRLCSVKFQGHIPNVDFKEDIWCLDEVCIDLYCPTACAMVDVSERRRRTSEFCMSMLHQLCEVKSLALSLNTIEEQQLLINIKRSRINVMCKDAMISIPIHVMSYILESSPSAELLIVELPKGIVGQDLRRKMFTRKSMYWHAGMQ
ncbi:F-box/FBD/LRR-repeat protein At2g04230-like isoform X2 [Olea europaea var. sylvestris]|uniref:F-box FBD LRR-repeat At5g53840-like n=1 Tax=Olea europaea subsp. europaea TaxID=158383 RepID=A0A8S0PFS2_OLEEU|nr:F-box/FBD/LRR-repeat protein At2g04230-like isoform X2 [Olea europaea var. sylvestris]CAA2942562.1 F-box FBD LRR-repeat At5g53840-like [Olea europaea subsp. europaea]